MSNEFKSQDHFRYKKLGKRWRRPVGWQSKLRLKKGGAGRKVSIGYGRAPKMQATMVSNFADLEKDCRYGILIAADVGSRKAMLIADKAKEKGITVLNMKKVRKAKRIAKEIEKKKTESKKEEKKAKAEKVETKKEEHAHSHEGHDHEGHTHEHAHEEEKQ